MIYKVYKKIGKIVGFKIKILILYLKYFKMFCLRRILGFYIYEYILYMGYLYEDISFFKFEIRFNKM